MAQQRYQIFARNLRLSYQPETGTIDADDRNDFISANLQPVSDFGLGLQYGLAAPMIGRTSAETLAIANMNHFLDQIQIGLQSELAEP